MIKTQNLAPPSSTIPMSTHILDTCKNYPCFQSHLCSLMTPEHAGELTLINSNIKTLRPGSKLYFCL